MKKKFETEIFVRKKALIYNSGSLSTKPTISSVIVLQITAVHTESLV